MQEIKYIDRQTNQEATEKVCASLFLRLLYGNGTASNYTGTLLQRLLCHTPAISAFVGFLARRRFSRHFIGTFVRRYGVDMNEYQIPEKGFSSFNEFFIRKLLPGQRPIVRGSDHAIIPADGRYLFRQELSSEAQFNIKGEQYDLARLLGSERLACRYVGGTIVIGRLCPSDYHRFHFPCDCVAEAPKALRGHWHSVNPLALRTPEGSFIPDKLLGNKRWVTLLHSTAFGVVAYIEVGALMVSSVVQTFQAGGHYHSGAEKGYFQFGASTVVLLFESGTLALAPDLAQAGAGPCEVRCLMGQPLGTKMGA